MVLSFRYDDIKVSSLCPSTPFNKSKSFLWWWNLRITLGPWGADVNWFSNCIACKVGREINIDFWRNYWIGQEPLCRQFFVPFEFLQGSRLNIGDAKFWLNGD